MSAAALSTRRGSGSVAGPRAESERETDEGVGRTETQSHGVRGSLRRPESASDGGGGRPAPPRPWALEAKDAKVGRAGTFRGPARAVSLSAERARGGPRPWCAPCFAKGDRDGEARRDRRLRRRPYRDASVGRRGARRPWYAPLVHGSPHLEGLLRHCAPPHPRRRKARGAR